MEIGNSNGDERRQAEDDEYPTLVPGPQDSVDRMVQAQADEASLTGQTMEIGSSKGQAPIKLLTRPASSGNNPAAGFSFTKAKPIQQLDFGRQRQAPAVAQPREGVLPSDAVPTGTRNNGSPSPTDVNHDGPMPQDPPHSRVSDDPKPTTTSGSESRILNIIIPNRYKSATTIHNPAEPIEVTDQPRPRDPNTTRKASKEPLTSVAGAPKVAKSRRKDLKTFPAGERPPSPSIHNKGYTEEDLLRLLMYRRRQGQQELEFFRATQDQKEAEIRSLSEQLHEVVQREAQNTAELSELKGKKPLWESKIKQIKQMSDYVKGLTNDHKRLREDADDLQRQHGEVCIAGKEFHIALENAKKTAEQGRISSQKHRDDARHRIETLTQTIQHQGAQLRDDETLLNAERERSNRLQAQISGITASHGQLMQLFTDHRDAITGRIDSLLHQAKSAVAPKEASEVQPDGAVRPMLEQCVGLLQKLHEVETITPKDLRKLNDTIDGFVRVYVFSSPYLAPVKSH